MIPDMTAARAVAEATLTETCAFTRAGTGSTFQPGVGIVEADRVPVWSGSCSLSPPTGTGDTSSTGGDETMIDIHVLRTPTACTGVKVGDRCDLPGRPPLWVKRVQYRTTEVLRRFRLSSVEDAEQVPR